MKPRFFWLLSDRRTVREIDLETYRYLNRLNRRKDNTCLLLVLFDSEIHVNKGISSVNVTLKQLNQILSAKQS